MTTDKMLMGAGLGLSVLMMLLLAIGTTSTALFLIYGVLAVAGAGLYSMGQRMRDRR